MVRNSVPHAAARAMDAILRPLLVGGGLAVSVSVSTSTKTATRAISAFHLPPSALRSTVRHRDRHRSPFLAAASESPSTPLAAAMAESQSRTSKWVYHYDLRLDTGRDCGEMRIYEALWDESYEFRWDIDEESSKVLATNLVSISDGASKLSSGENEFWLVRMEKPGVQVVTKAQMVDHCTQVLMKVLGNEQDAQVSIYHISWERDYGFCCHIDEECAKEVADVPGVLSVQPDTNFGSDNKDYKVAEALSNNGWVSAIRGSLSWIGIGEFLQLWDCIQGIVLNDQEDKHIWRLEAGGTYFAKSAYRAYFHGSITFEPWKRLWKSWAPNKCKVFLWLAIRNRCWTADRLARRGLPHPEHCPLCDQEDETVQHILRSGSIYLPP